jgi:carbonic anhydrase
MQIEYRDTPADEASTREPADADEAIAWLESGNRQFAGLASGQIAVPEAGIPFVINADFGVGSVVRAAPEQRPFGLVLGCSDARVPIELVFGRAVNDLFVVRVAGNTIGDDAIASLTYAADHFATAKTIVVLGHTQCGAVAAAVDVFLKPRRILDLAATPQLRALVDRILVGVRVASMALQEVYGHDVVTRDAYAWTLLHLSVFVNASYVGFCVNAALPPALRRRVVYGVYDISTGQVTSGFDGTFAEPPADAAAFRELALALAATPRMRELLGAVT